MLSDLVVSLSGQVVFLGKVKGGVIADLAAITYLFWEVSHFLCGFV